MNSHFLVLFGVVMLLCVGCHIFQKYYLSPFTLTPYVCGTIYMYICSCFLIRLNCSLGFFLLILNKPLFCRRVFFLVEGAYIWVCNLVCLIKSGQKHCALFILQLFEATKIICVVHIVVLSIQSYSIRQIVYDTYIFVLKFVYIQFVLDTHQRLPDMQFLGRMRELIISYIAFRRREAISVYVWLFFFLTENVARVCVFRVELVLICDMLFACVFFINSHNILFENVCEICGHSVIVFLAMLILNALK